MHFFCTENSSIKHIHVTSLFSNPGTTYQIGRTPHGTRQLLHKGKQYFVEDIRGNVTHWRCLKRTCHARIYTRNDSIIRIWHIHNH